MEQGNSDENCNRLENLPDFSNGEKLSGEPFSSRDSHFRVLNHYRQPLAS